MAKMRHWKQRFDPGAQLIFRKRMKLGMCGVDVVSFGDPVTEDMKQQLGRHRLKMWWEAQMIQIADEGTCFDGPSNDFANPEPLGSGWFAVTMPDGQVKKIRGKEKALELLNG